MISESFKQSLTLQTKVHIAQDLAALPKFFRFHLTYKKFLFLYTPILGEM
jgi:hypothetical protein